MKRRNKTFRRANRRYRRKRHRSATSRRRSHMVAGRSQTGGHPGTPVLDIRTCKSLGYRDYIGNESRTLEFKQGEGAYLQNTLYRHVCMYGCAFLNGGGGILLVGVRDNGVVCGVSLGHKMEDEVRLHVDNAIKTFQPPVFPCSYSLDFLPVVRHGQESQLKVVRLTFTPPPAAMEPTLFQSGPGEVYIKRDGSVQGPLSVSSILEWNKMMWGGKVQQLQQSAHQATCEQWFLTGRFSWFSDPLHQVVASLSANATWTKEVPRSGPKLTDVVLQPPADSAPHRPLRTKRRNTK